jgi:membrane protease YdiL (CAAX protease family)
LVRGIENNGRALTSFIEFAARGKNAWWRYVASLVAGGLATVALFTAATLLLSLLHIIPRDFAAQFTRPRDPRVFFGGVAMVFAAFLAGSAGAIAVVQRKRIGDVIGRWRWSAFFRGVVVWSIVQAAITLIDFEIAPGGFRLTLGHGTLLLAVTALIALPTQTFAEEFVFRGWLTQGLLLLLKRPLAAALSAGAIFGALHLWNGAPQAIQAFIFGSLYALIAIRTGGIGLPFGLHLANNYFDAVVAVSAGDVFRGCPGILLQDTPQLVWSDIGLSAAALVLVCCFATSDRPFGRFSRRTAY